MTEPEPTAPEAEPTAPSPGPPGGVPATAEPAVVPTAEPAVVPTAEPAAPPADVVAAARERAEARQRRDWARADTLKARIEAAGWKVIDKGTRFRLERATPPTIVASGRTHYGSAPAVPSRLDDPADRRFTAVLLAEDWPDDLARSLSALREHAPPGTQVVVVANAPSAEQATRLTTPATDPGPVAGAPPEVVWTSTRLGHAAACNVGIRRARGAIVVLADTSVEATGDAFTPIEEALADPDVAVAGWPGFVTPDLRRFDDAPGPGADVIGRFWLAFRRADYAALGPLDEHFAHIQGLDVWWSLVLRAGADPDRPPRVAAALDLPLARHEHRDWMRLPAAERDRLARRNFYRVLDRFRDRPDLRSGAPASG